MSSRKADVVVIGAGPAGILAAIRAGDLGARTILLSRGEFGGMAANDGPVPARTLGHAARLLREAKQLGRYGISVQEPKLDYPRLLERVREVVNEVRAHSALRAQIDQAGVSVQENFGAVRFIDAHTIESEKGLRLEADKFIICTGGVSRKLSVPGSELTHTHSDAWSLDKVPESMLVIGAGATGAQVASIFNAFGTKIQLFQAGPRILPTEDPDVSQAVATGFRASGISIHENFGAIESFEKAPRGVRMNFSKNGEKQSAVASLAIVAVGWIANTEELNLSAAGVSLNERGFVQVNEYQQTSAAHIFAAGDVTGRLMLAPQAIHDGFRAATNAVKGLSLVQANDVSPIGSFTDPEYAQVGLSETRAHETFDVVATTVPFDAATRAIMDGRTFGFCKLIADRKTEKILGCHVVGEQAVEIAQMAATAMASGLRVQDLSAIPFSFPTYAGVLGRASATLARQLNQSLERPMP